MHDDAYTRWRIRAGTHGLKELSAPRPLDLGRTSRMGLRLVQDLQSNSTEHRQTLRKRTSRLFGSSGTMTCADWDLQSNSTEQRQGLRKRTSQPFESSERPPRWLLPRPASHRNFYRRIGVKLELQKWNALLINLHLLYLALPSLPSLSNFKCSTISHTLHLTNSGR